MAVKILQKYGHKFQYKTSEFGQDTYGHDLKAYGDTTGKYVFWDASANTLTIAGTLTYTGATFKQGYDAAAYWTATVADGGGVTFDSVSDGTSGFTFSDKVNITAIPATYTASSLAVGYYGTPIVETALTDNILFSANLSTGTNKTSADSSTMAAFIGVRNTAATTNNKLQGILASTTVPYNCYDAYAVQGHIALTGDMGTQNANAHLTGISGKATVSSGKTVATGWVTGGLFIIDGAGTVTQKCYAVSAVVEASVTCAQGILELYSDSTVNSAIQVTGVANVTNFIDFAADAGCVLTNALVPATAPDGGTMGADRALQVDVNGTPYYIPMYNTLHA